MKQVIVTTSWDDGHKLDVRLAALLQKYGVKGTFYVSPHDQEFAPADLLSDDQVKQLSNSFEIGAHTMTHPRLPKVSDEQALQEIVDSKRYLEKIIGRPVKSFCYPGGNYNARHVPMVRAAGFVYARTVRRHVFGFKGFPFEADTTVNAYNHYQDLWKIAKFAHFNPLRTLRYFQWDNLAKAMFDYTLKHGGVFHLWGHSWEIDNHKDWEKLEDVLRYISGRQDVQYLTNGELNAARPRRLLMACPYFPPSLGGVEFYTYNIARALQDAFGWQVCVATAGNRGFKRIEKTTYKNLTVFRLPYWLSVSNTPINPLWYFSLKRIIKRESIDIVNTQAPVVFMADVASWAAKNVPVVATYHATTMQKGWGGLDWIARLYERSVLPRTLGAAAQVVCASELVRDDFLQAYRDKSVIITPGVDTEFFHPAKALPKRHVLFVGSLQKTNNYKGVPNLLEAFAAVLKNVPDADLTIVGDGSGKKDFEDAARKLDIAARVHFVGGKYKDDLKHAYQAAGIFVLPTQKDNFPLVILEAMATGLPVISTRVGAIPSVIDNDKTGYTIPPNDTSELAEKLTYLLLHPDVAKRLGAAGRKKVEQDFSWKLQARKTHQVLLRQLGIVEI